MNPSSTKQSAPPRRDPEMFAAIGQKGGETTRERYGAAHYAAIGSKGGSKTAQRNGSNR